MLAAATDPSVAHDIAGKRFVSRKRRRGAKEHAGALGSPSGSAPRTLGGHSRGRRPAPAPASGCPADGPPVALADKVARVAQAVTAMGERY